jgi:ArsR family transcriptional regulator
MELSEIFKALGDETRLRILNLLSEHELCVYQINQVLALKEPNMSKHLNRLKYAGLISGRKKSQWCYYYTDKEFLNQNKILYDYLLCQWSNKSRYIDDLKNLENLFEGALTQYGPEST